MSPAGPLREPIDVETVSFVSDGAGGQTEIWTAFMQIWAEVEVQRPSETDLTGGLATHQTIRIRTPYNKDLNAQMRLVWNELTYRITMVFDPDGRRRDTLITAERYNEA